MIAQYVKIFFALILLTHSKLGLNAGNLKPAKFCTLAIPGQSFEIRAEIAGNQAQREQGLMFRKALAENQGMLFVYNDVAQRYVWMKNTVLPLDVLFLAADGRIVSTLKNIMPCRKWDCDVYSSEQPAVYMLEVNSGFIEKRQLKTGDILLISCP